MSPLPRRDLAAALARLASLRARLDDCDNPFSAHLDDARRIKLERSLTAAGDADVPGLEWALGSRADAIRREAAGLLSGLQATPVVVAALTRMVRHHDATVRRCACQGLARAGEPAFDTVAPLAEDPSADVAQAAIRALFALAPERALAATLPLAASPRPELRLAVAEQALAHGLGEPDGVDGSGAIAALVEDPDHRVRRQAIAALHRWAPEVARRALGRALVSGSDPLVRHDAVAGMLGFVCERRVRLTLHEAGVPLAPAFCGVGRDAREASVRALAGAKDPAAVARALEGPEGTIDGALLVRLADPRAPGGSLGMPAAADLFEAGLVGVDDAIDAIRQGLASGATLTLRRAAALAVRANDARLADALAQSAERALSESDVRRALGALGPVAADALLTVIMAGDERARVAAALRLVRANIDGAAGRAAASLEHAEPEAGRSLVRALEQLGGDEALAALRGVALDRTAPLSLEAAAAALRRGERSVSSRLEEAVRGDDEDLARDALRALVDADEVGRSLTPALLEWADVSTDPRFHRVIAQALGASGDRRGRATLRRFAGSSWPPLGEAAGRALERMGLG